MSDVDWFISAVAIMYSCVIFAAISIGESKRACRLFLLAGAVVSAFAAGLAAITAHSHPDGDPMVFVALMLIAEFAFLELESLIGPNSRAGDQTPHRGRRGDLGD